MKLVVTKKKCEYGAYTVKDNIVGIDWKQVDVLIFNSCVNTDVDTILEISKAGEVVEKAEDNTEDKPQSKRRERKKRNADQLDADAKQLIDNNAETVDAEEIISGDTVPF